MLLILQNVDKGEEVKNTENFADVLCEWFPRAREKGGRNTADGDDLRAFYRGPQGQEQISSALGCRKSCPKNVRLLMDDRISARTGENVAFLLITEKRCRLGSLQIYIHWTTFWTTNPLEWKNLTGGLNLIRLTFPQAGEEKS